MMSSSDISTLLSLPKPGLSLTLKNEHSSSTERMPLPSLSMLFHTFSYSSSVVPLFIFMYGTLNSALSTRESPSLSMLDSIASKSPCRICLGGMVATTK